MRSSPPQTVRQVQAERAWSLKTAMGQSIAVAMKELLTSKHLYHYVDVDLAPVAAQGKLLNDEVRRAGPNISSNTVPDYPAAPELLKTDADSPANVT
jgi:hypothetical protein